MFRKIKQRTIRYKKGQFLSVAFFHTNIVKIKTYPFIKINYYLLECYHCEQCVSAFCHYV